jgi:hypothetical protein
MLVSRLAMIVLENPLLEDTLEEDETDDSVEEMEVIFQTQLIHFLYTILLLQIQIRRGSRESKHDIYNCNILA